MYKFVKELALPPTSLVLLLAAGILLQAIGWRRAGFCLSLLALLSLYLLSTPYIASQLGEAAQVSQPLRHDIAAQDAPQAIVVLAAGLLPYAPEYMGSTVDQITMQRLAYAAYLWRQYKVPILVSGGNAPGVDASLADLMKQALEQVFDVPVKWAEDKSVDTYENAKFSAAILREQGISRILLVTHAVHMPRAARLFHVEGLAVSPAPTIFAPPAGRFPQSFIPRLAAFQNSYYALYELFGGAWYAMRGRT